MSVPWVLNRVGLGELDHEPSQMSGGQQRVAIAFSGQSAMLLADEPTGDSRCSEILAMFRS